MQGKCQVNYQKVLRHNLLVRARILHDHDANITDCETLSDGTESEMSTDVNGNTQVMRRIKGFI